MDDRALKYFEIVTKTQSVRAASEILHVSPSAISRKIAQLESQLDVSLMDRVGRGIKITESGMLLAKYIQDMNQRKNNLLSQISELEHLQTGTLRIAIGGGFIPDFINNAITTFSHKYPGVKLELQVGGGDDVIESIKNEKADIGLLLNSKQDPKVDILYSCEFQELSLLVPNTSQWASLNVCSPSQLSEIPLALLNENFTIRRAINLYQVRQAIRLNTLLECNSFEALKDFVKSGLGGTLLPKVCVVKELQDEYFTAIPVEGMHMLDTTIDLVMRKGRVPTASTKEIQSCIIRHMSAFNVAENN